MKKKSFIIKKIIAGAFAALITLSVAVPANANNKARVPQTASSIQPTLTFAGREGNGALFAVALENEAPVRFELSIRDADGDVIYKQAFEASSFAKTFKLVNEQRVENLEGLSFHIRILPSGTDHNFEVSSSSETVNAPAISKI